MPAFSQITDDGFPGAKSLDFIGQRIVYVEPFGRYWGWSDLVDGSSWNTLNQAQAETSPDRIQGLIVSHNEVLIFGERTIEPWASAPTDTAVFQLQVGSVIESGCAAGRSIQRLDNSVFYLTNNGQIAKLNGYTPQVISTAAMEASIRGLNWSRAFAFTWEDAGHVVYYITFPDGHTWGYDVRQNKWHRRASYGLDRWRINALAKSNGKYIAGDYSSGRVYEVEWGNVYEACEIMPRTFRSGVLHNASNRVRVDGFRLVSATGQPPTYPTPLFDMEPEVASDILITGNGTGGTPTPFITGKAVEVPTLVGIPTATGANLNNTRCSVNSDGVYIAVGEDELLYSTNITSTWLSVATSYPDNTGRFGVFGTDGWLLQYEGASHAGMLGYASSVPIDAAALTINIAGGGTRTTLSWIKYVDGKYYGCVGFGGGNLLLSCETLDGTWDVVTTETGSITTGTDAVRFFYDIEKFDGALYAACYVASDFGGLGGGDCVRKSTDDGATWDVLVLDGRSDGTIMPFQLARGNGKLIAVNRDASKAWTSDDNFTASSATGVSRGTADLPRNEKEGRYVAYASRRFFIMGDAGLVSTVDGITFAAVSAYPAGFNVPVSIAAYSDPDATPVPVDCTPMEGGLFQLRYANDGSENWSNWRDFEAPTTGRFLQPLVWRRLGMARHRVWEVMDTSNRPQDVLAAEIIAQ